MLSVPTLPPVPGLDGLPGISSASSATSGPVNLSGSSFGAYAGADYSGMNAGEGASVSRGVSPWLIGGLALGALYFLMRGKV